MENIENLGDIIIYQSEDGNTKIDVKIENETVWLTQMQMAELFDTSKQDVNYHINNIFKENELEENRTVKEFLTVQDEGNRKVSRRVKYYNIERLWKKEYVKYIVYKTIFYTFSY